MSAGVAGTISKGATRFALLALVVGCSVSALLVINSSYKSRVLVNDLHHVRAQGDLLAAQRERLELDFAWWAGQTRVDRDARKLLGMLPVTQVKRLHFNANGIAK